VGMEGVYEGNTLALCLGTWRRPLAEYQDRDIGERVAIGNISERSMERTDSTSGHCFYTHC
jgi:hypothetical protein